MEAFTRDDLPVAIATGGTEIRAKEVGGMAVAFYRLAPGSDLRRHMHGLPGDACTCPHWGYVIKGKLRIHTRDGAHDVVAGQAFYVEPGHVPEVLEEIEMVEVSPLKELREVGEHVGRQIALEGGLRA